MAKKIVVLAGHLAQINITHRALALTPGLEDVDTSTIDTYKMRHNERDITNPQSTRGQRARNERPSNITS